MRAFNIQQQETLLNAFGEDLVLSSGVTIVALFEQEIVHFEDMLTVENYFTCKVSDISNTDTFTRNNKLYQVLKIIDNLSGLVDVHYGVV
ncbi:hypothetical protein ACSJEN_002790 [Yersinia enterocolitica]